MSRPVGSAPTLADRRRLSDEALAGFLKSATRLLPGGTVQDREGALVVVGVDEASTAALRTRGGRHPSPVRVLELLRDAAGGRPAQVIARSWADGDLEAHLGSLGAPLVMDLPAMVLDRPVEPPRAGTDVRRVTDGEGLTAFVAVARAAFPDSAAVLDAMACRADACLGPDVAVLVASVDGRPVAVAMAARHGAVAALDWVGTIPAMRGRGLGEAVTRAASNAGFELGATLVALQAGPDAARIYRRIGYEEVGRYRWYRAPLAGAPIGKDMA